VVAVGILRRATDRARGQSGVILSSFPPLELSNGPVRRCAGPKNGGAGEVRTPDLRFRKTPKIFLTAFLGRDGSVGFVGRTDGEFMMDAACESQPSAVKVVFKGDG